MIARTGMFTLVFAALVMACSVVHARQSKSFRPKAAAARHWSAQKKLIGSWQPRGGKAVVFLPDGTGKNPDGSRFTWRLEGDYLVAQALSAVGQPTGQVARTPILFTRDGKEYATFLERGRLKTPFYRLRPNGKPDPHRTRAGGAYPPNKFLPKVNEDEEENAPATHIEKNKESLLNRPHESATVQNQPAEVRATQAIHVGPNVQVSRAWPRVPHAEVTLAADPQHPDWLLAGSMFSPPPYDPLASKVIVYASWDGGKTWNVSLERKNRNPQTYADPAFACGPDGTLFFVNMYWPKMDAKEGRALQFTHTLDGGKTWSAATEIDGLHDRPFLAVDTTQGMRRGWLYCTDGLPDRSVFVSRDQAATFLPAVGWSKRSNEAVLMGNPVVTSDGSLVLLYTTLPGEQDSARAGGSRTRAMDPDQATPHSVSEKPTVICSVKIVRSQDGGASFLEAQSIADYHCGPGRGGLPMLAVDPGSPAYKDRLYAVWVDIVPGGSRVMLARSRDGGATWTAPLLLSEQPAEGPQRGNETGSAAVGAKSFEAFLPSVAVNKEGVDGVAWYDTRGLVSSQAGWNLRFRASLDGGATWLPSVRVTDVSTVYTKDRKRRFPTETRSMYYQPGHTAGLAADANGCFHPLWIDGRTGIRQVFTATVLVAGNQNRGELGKRE